MSLIPDPERPGLWVNPSRPRGTPGTFAVVVGVSAYQHLSGGAGPPATTDYGLGQLYVSALTAYQFFRWLSDSYRCAHAPVGQVWLLLSPTPDEKAQAPGIDQHILAPTFQNCSYALRTWVQSMRLLAAYSAASAEESRAIFFFSGHGIEVFLEKQLLCPSDYLEPPAGSVNDAISTLNLWEALGTVPVGEQVLLYDACRNDTTELKMMNRLEGADILNVSLGQQFDNRRAIKATATGPGTAAWQPERPADNGGRSVFGRALLEGLSAQGGIELDCNGDPCCLRSAPLETYLRARVPELLQSFSTRKGEAAPRQPVRFLGDNATSIAITEFARRGGPVLPPPAPTIGAKPTVVPAGPRPMTFDADAFTGPHIPVAAALHDVVYQERRVLTPAWNPLLVPDYNAAFVRGHEIFGSEVMTRIWIGDAGVQPSAHVFSYARNAWLDPVRAFEIHYVEHNADASMHNVVLSLGEHGTCWLQLADMSGMKFGVVLPGDESSRARYLLKLNVSPHSPTVGWTLSSVEASLAKDNPELLARAYDLWEKYRSVNVLEAADSIDMALLEETLRYKVQSPLAATIASIILLRAGREELLHDWLENLATWSPDLPDGPVLRAEQILRQSRAGGSPERAIYWISQLLDRGLPRTAETMSFLGTQLETLLRRADIGNSVKQLTQVHAGMSEALRYLRSGGLFVTYAGKTLTPDVTRLTRKTVAPAAGGGPG